MHVRNLGLEDMQDDKQKKQSRSLKKKMKENIKEVILNDLRIFFENIQDCRGELQRYNSQT